MRPDEHKKKKNAAYKKKHGIVQDASDKKDEKTKKKDKSTTENKHERIERHTKQETSFQTKPHPLSQSSVSGSSRHGTRDSSGVKAENSSSDVSSSDTENEDTSSRKAPSKLFKKRQIVSNWQKYELPPDAEEKISGRGESYEKLLHMTGEAISHFRFKDELVWDDPGETSHDSSNDAYSELLSVNPAELARSLACLPVHHILAISSNVFPDDQLSSMVCAAKNIRSQYTMDTQEEFTGNTSHSDKSEPIEESMNSRLHSSPEIDKNKPVTAGAAATKQTKVASAKATFLTPVASVKIQPHQVDTSTGSSAGLVGQETCHGKTSNTLKDPAGKLQLQDDDLDALLNTDNPMEVSTVDGSPSIQSGNTEGDSKLASESEDLEAWLDSVLDD